ncbi:methyltransferase [Streptomyces sp. JJ36]|uniref:DUF7059 domain-containing protein n=1 Tax=Streptomyces sp. JJ36 TaxID=2736645 RepID=UPI001F3254EF|nr:class I SAM-dependent methyltransferase [Streptomyces sp. JJ36]MCF6522586.1 class I SAM-dependent methyltransferase [Streptomyces sp. JJ36]
MGRVTTHPLPTPAPEAVDRLRTALLAARFTPDGLLELLGATAYAALARSEIVPALRVTRDGGPPAALVRLFLLRQAVPRAEAAAALPVAEALADGWLVPADPDDPQAAPDVPAVSGHRADARTEGAGAVRATVDIRPYAGPEGQDWWIVSDLGCAVGGAGGIRARHEDVVLGVGGASTTLAGLTVRKPVGRALDLGTGSGIQALHAAQHASRVTATDLNPRALGFARLTLALSGAPEPDLRQGSLFEPVAGGGPYDLIVSNPPLVISPDTRFEYRDSGMRGDGLCRTLVQQAGDHLAEGGYCQLLANWEHRAGEDWRERVAGWVPQGCDAWIIQRDVQDITQYTELWLRDAGDHHASEEAYAARYDAWLDAFEARGTEAVGFGWIVLRATSSGSPSVLTEEWPHPVEQPLGDAVRGYFERRDFLRRTDDAALLGAHFRLAEGVVQEQVGMPGAEDPEHVVLRQRHGLRRATQVDTVGAGFAGVCDGSLPAGRILDAIAQLLGEDPVRLRDRTPESIRLLVEQGFLEPVAGPA